MTIPNKEEFEKVCKELEKGQHLTFRMIGRVFGTEFWEMLVLTMADIKIVADRMEVHFYEGGK